MISTNASSQGYRFTITAPSTGTQYNFSNLSDAFSSAANEVDTTATSGASSPATLKITVMGRWNQIDGENITFNVDLDGTGGATAFTLNFTNAAGTDSTVWTHNPGSSSSTNTSTTTKNRYRYDNGYVTHQIPQSDYQYQWVMLSHTASYATSSLSTLGNSKSIACPLQCWLLGLPPTSAFRSGQRYPLLGIKGTP